MTNQQAPAALRLAGLLQAAAQIYPQRSEDDPGGYATEVDKVMDEAAAELRRLQHIESAALLALGLLWMTNRDNDKVQTAFQTLRNALDGMDALRKGIEAAIDAGYEADHPLGAYWWAGKKEHPHD